MGDNSIGILTESINRAKLFNTQGDAKAYLEYVYKTLNNYIDKKQLEGAYISIENITQQTVQEQRRGQLRKAAAKQRYAVAKQAQALELESLMI